mmetsp:Transcript_25729/g.66553  ORF Transcript_25729/g.66553 Transcript_25729/m.66553 type:complete len:218 (-) Transcript_25729:263-916(-)
MPVAGGPGISPPGAKAGAPRPQAGECDANEARRGEAGRLWHQQAVGQHPRARCDAVRHDSIHVARAHQGRQLWVRRRHLGDGLDHPRDGIRRVPLPAGAQLHADGDAHLRGSRADNAAWDGLGSMRGVCGDMPRKGAERSASGEQADDRRVAHLAHVFARDACAVLGGASHEEGCVRGHSGAPSRWTPHLARLPSDNRRAIHARSGVQAFPCDPAWL